MLLRILLLNIFLTGVMAADNDSVPAPHARFNSRVAELSKLTLSELRAATLGAENDAVELNAIVQAALLRELTAEDLAFFYGARFRANAGFGHSTQQAIVGLFVAQCPRDWSAEDIRSFALRSQWEIPFHMLESELVRYSSAKASGR